MRAGGLEKRCASPRPGELTPGGRPILPGCALLSGPEEGPWRRPPPLGQVQRLFVRAQPRPPTSPRQPLAPPPPTPRVHGAIVRSRRPQVARTHTTPDP